jgi:putative transcriptional regulator
MVRLKLKGILDERGISQKELAKLTEIQESLISFLVRNKRDSINTIHLAKVMRALDITDFNEILELVD